jgi:hypothetical protein
MSYSVVPAKNFCGQLLSPHRVPRFLASSRSTVPSSIHPQVIAVITPGLFQVVALMAPVARPCCAPSASMT